MESVNRDAYRATLINDVIPAIKAKWPASGKKKPIYIQQDNCRAHVLVGDPEVVAACRSGGWNIMIRCQPPNSPDLNVLDLGYFRAVQSLQYQMDCRSLEDLLKAVNSAFESHDYEKLNDIFLTLQKVMECILSVKGGNEYKLPHLFKSKLKATNSLPIALHCSEEIYATVNQLE